MMCLLHTSARSATAASNCIRNHHERSIATYCSRCVRSAALRTAEWQPFVTATQAVQLRVKPRGLRKACAVARRERRGDSAACGLVGSAAGVRVGVLACEPKRDASGEVRPRAGEMRSRASSNATAAAARLRPVALS